MPNSTDTLTTIAMATDEYKDTPHAVDASKLENGPKTPEQQEYERVKAIRLDGDLDEIPVDELVTHIQSKLEYLGKAKGIAEDDKKTFEKADKAIGTWVKRLNPENNPNDKEIYEQMPAGNREVIFNLYKREIVDTLGTIDELMRSFNTKESRVIATTLIRSKTANFDLQLQEIFMDLRENLDRTKIPDEKVTKIATALHDLHNMGPIPFRSFVQEQFAGIDVNSPESLEEINTRIDKLEKTRTKVHQKNIEVFDDALKPSERKTFERIADPEKKSNEYRWQHADRSRGLDSTIASKYVEKSFWYGERTRETPQYVNLTQGVAEKIRADGKAELIKVDMVDITIFAEVTEREAKGLEIGTALQQNRFNQNKLYNTRADSLEACYHELERWGNHKVLGANGEEIRPIYVDKATGKVYADKEQTQLIPQPLKYRILVPGRDTLGNKIDETLDIDQKTMNKVLVTLSTAVRHWELKGFKLDPEKLKKLEAMETPTNRVEQLRQKSFVEETYDKVIADKKAQGDLDASQIGLFEDAKEHTSEMYEAFIQRYGRMDEYRKIAETRVRERGIPEDTMPWVHEVEQEIYNVTVEMTQLERVLRSVTMDVLAYTRYQQPGTTELDSLLINLDNEITARLATKLISMREGTYDLALIQTRVRTLLGPYIRRPTNTNTNTINSIILHPTEAIPPAPTIDEMNVFFEWHRMQDESTAATDIKEVGELVFEERERKGWNIKGIPLLTATTIEEGEWGEMPEDKNAELIAEMLEEARQRAADLSEIEEGEFYEKEQTAENQYALPTKVDEIIQERSRMPQETALVIAENILKSRQDILNPNLANEVNAGLEKLGIDPLPNETLQEMTKLDPEEIDSRLSILVEQAVIDEMLSRNLIKETAE